MWFCRSPDVRGNPGCSDGASQTRGDETSGVQGVDPGYFMLGGLTWILSLKVFFLNYGETQNSTVDHH